MICITACNPFSFYLYWTLSSANVQFLFLFKMILPLTLVIICQREQRPIELMLNPIPLTLMDRWNSLFYHNYSIRNLR